MSTTTVETPQGICRFGLERTDITPPVDIYHRMWGAAAHDRATGVHRPLKGTAMVFQSADEPPGRDTLQAVIALDHCLFWAREMDAFLRTVSDGCGLEREQITVVFSHTHAAGLMGLERRDLPGGELIEPYLDQTARQMAHGIRAAAGRLQTVTLAHGVGHCALAAQRDFRDDEAGQWVCGFNPDASCDDRLLVTRITAEDGRILATLVNYACHPTTLAWDNTLISPDFPGAMREVVEEQTRAPCVFLQGASGDVGPVEGFTGDLEVADRNGRQLGFATLAALESLPPPRTRFEYAGPVVSGATIGTWEHREVPPERSAELRRWRLERWTVDLPYRSDLPSLAEADAERAEWLDKERQARAAGDEAEAADCRAMAERKLRLRNRLEVLPPEASFPYPVTMLAIGDAVWLFLEGEVYNVFQRTLRGRFPGVPLYVLTLAGGSRISYLPPAELYGQGVYQESVALLAPGCLETLTESAAQRIDAWQRERARPSGQRSPAPHRTKAR